MSIAPGDFWKLAIDSRLLSAEDCRRLAKGFAQSGATDRGSVALAQWLVSTGTISRYQARVLLSGRTGPFIFAEYKLVERIDRGRLAGLFRALHSASNERVLLDFVRGQQSQDPLLWDQMQQQARWAISETHPSLCRVYELLDLGAYKFLVFESLEGASLAERRDQKLATTQACQIASQVAAALARLAASDQSHGFVHPANVWLSREGPVHGPANLLCVPLVPAATDWAATAEQLAAQADYLAPELEAPGSIPTELSDVYSLGCVLFELLSGRVPFPGGDVADKLRRHAQEAIEPLEKTAAVEPPLAQVVAKMLAKEPRWRFQSATAVIEALAPFVPAAAPPAPQISTPSPSAQIATTVPPPAQTAAAEEPSAADPAFTTPADGRSDPELDLGLGDLSVSRRRSAGKRRAKKKAWSANSTVLAILAALVLVGSIELAILKPWEAHETKNSAAQSDSPVVAGISEPSTTKPDASASRKSDPTPLVPVALDVKSQHPSKSADRPRQVQIEEVDDDGQSLWASPTKGTTLDAGLLRYLPSSAQLLLVLRPAEILQNPEGVKLLAALEMGGDSPQAPLESIIGMPLDRVEQLIVAVAADDSGPQLSLVVRLREVAAQAELLAAWKNPAAKEGPGKQYFAGADWAYCIAPESQGRVFAVAEPASMQAILERAGPPFLHKEIEHLLRTADSARHFSLILAPGFLLTEGKSLLRGKLQKLDAPLAWFFGSTAGATLASVHLGSDLFLELRVRDALSDPRELAKQYRDRLGKISDRLESTIATLSPHPYGKLIVLRLPRMMQIVRDFTRIDVENNQSVLRCYLPVASGHNLALGAELALLEKTGGSTTAMAASNKNKPDIAAALKKKVSLSFARDTLQNCLELLAKEIEVEIVVVGPDLQLDGIAKNKSFGLDEHDKPAEEILQTIMKTASPEGKLVYVIKPKDAGQPDAIFITTRGAVAKRGDPLPPEMQIPEDKPKKKR